jgi:CheY-like chemotaxis protein
MKKVLLASGYTFFVRKMSNLVMRMGFHLFTETSGVAAIGLHGQHDFDLIILDYKLEDMHGPALCTLIRQGDVSPQVPIIMTCHNLSGSMARARESGATSVVVKPFEPVTMIELMGTHLGMQLVRSRRVSLRANVTCRSRELEFTCLSHDVSTTGILLETDYGLDLGRRISCWFTLPNDCRIEVEGVVTRFKTAPELQNLYGIKFVEIPSPMSQNIDAYITSVPTDVPLRTDSPLDITPFTVF